MVACSGLNDPELRNATPVKVVSGAGPLLLLRPRLEGEDGGFPDRLCQTRQTDKGGIWMHHDGGWNRSEVRRQTPLGLEALAEG